MFKNKLCFLAGACLVAAQAVATESPNGGTQSYPAYQLPTMFNGAPTSAQAAIRTAVTPADLTGTRPGLGRVGNGYSFNLYATALPGYAPYVIDSIYQPAGGIAWNSLGVRLH